MTRIGATTDVSFLTANLMLWGEMGDHPTALTFDDEKRAEQIGGVIAEQGADVVGFTEVWSPDRAAQLASILQTSTAHPLPNIIAGPFGLGLEGIATELGKVHPRLADLGRTNVDRIIHTAFREDNDTLGIDDTDEVLAASILHAMISLPFTLRERTWGWLKDLVNRAIQALLHGQKVFGSGLQLGSQHPIEDADFIPHPTTGGVEGYSDKGVRRAKIVVDGRLPVTTLLTHLIHGETALARAVRDEQLAQLADIVQGTVGPLVLAGDLNVRGDTKDWLAMLSRLGLADAYREVHPDAGRRPGHTFRGENEFAARLGMRGVAADTRLDYILYRQGQGLTPRGAIVLNGAFELPTPVPGLSVRSLSDHRPVKVDFAVAP